MKRNNEDILNRFISSKEIEGCSIRTLNYYRDNIILVTTKGHIVCCKRGNVIDSWDSSLKEVEFIWKVE